MNAPLRPDIAIPYACHSCEVRRGGVCGALKPDELIRMAAHSRRTRHAAGDALTIESDEVVGYANLTRGTVKLTRVLRDGRQQLVGLQFAPALMGRLYSTESLLSAEAATDVELCRIPREILEALVCTSSALKQHLLAQSLEDLDEAREWMVTLGRKSAIERVAFLLVLVAARAGVEDTRGEVAIELPIGRADMADFLGLTVETVSRQMSRLGREGLIAVKGHRCVVIRDLAALRLRTG